MSYGTTQSAFDNAFEKDGEDIGLAASLITKLTPMNEEQIDTLSRASGQGGRLRFDPEPVGHIAFAPVQTHGSPQRGRHALVPATQACKHCVNSLRREQFQRKMRVPRHISDDIFTKLQGWEPALKVAVDLWAVLSINPDITLAQLTDKGFHPHSKAESEAIAGIRIVLQSLKG
jgi:hypothetical protein